MATSKSAVTPTLARTPMVIAPDIILDLILGRGPAPSAEAAALFDAIASDVEAGKESRPAYIAPITVPMIHYAAKGGGSPSIAASITMDILRLLTVAPLSNEDYFEATHFRDFEYEDALQFVTCRGVGAQYLVTRSRYGGVKRTPVKRRTAGEMLPFFRK